MNLTHFHPTSIKNAGNKNNSLVNTFPAERGCERNVSVPTENGVFKQPAMCLRLLTTISGNPATSKHVDLAWSQPCGLAVKWTVNLSTSGLECQHQISCQNISHQKFLSKHQI